METHIRRVHRLLFNGRGKLHMTSWGIMGDGGDQLLLQTGGELGEERRSSPPLTPLPLPPHRHLDLRHPILRRHRLAPLDVDLPGGVFGLKAV